MYLVFLLGMNSTEDIIPQISDESVAITGAYDNLTLTWALTFPVVTEVHYNVTVFHETDGQILIQQVCFYSLYCKRGSPQGVVGVFYATLSR